MRRRESWRSSCSSSWATRLRGATTRKLTVIASYVDRNGSFSLTCHLHESLMLYTSEAVSDYFLTVLAGLAGSAHMVSATLLALSRLVYEFHGKSLSISLST